MHKRTIRMIAFLTGRGDAPGGIASCHGVMAALVDGRDATAGFNRIITGLQRVEVDRFHDIDEYRPVVR